MTDQPEGLSMGAVIKSLAPLTENCMFALNSLGNFVLDIKSIEHEWSRYCFAVEEIVLPRLPLGIANH